MKEYPTPDNGKIVALVDTSAFDSIQGMAIGEHGVSWLNRLSHSYSSYYWKDFSVKVISLENGLLKIGKSGSFELIGDSQQNKTLVAFLQNIQRVYLERENEYKHPEDIIDQVLSQDSKPQQGIKISTDMPRQSDSIKVTNNLIDLNTADLDSLLALPGIGVAEAKSLIKHRDVAGPFTSTKQVFDFLNLKPHHANQWKDRVVINETISPQTSTTAATPNPEIRRPLGGRTID
jgi:DNA uptake protein ComE-like DNA-binding protein